MQEKDCSVVRRLKYVTSHWSTQVSNEPKFRAFLTYFGLQDSSVHNSPLYVCNILVML